MEKRLNKRIEEYLTTFKNDIKQKSQNAPKTTQNIISQFESYIPKNIKPKNHKDWFYYTPLSKPLISTKQDHEIIKTLDKPLIDVFMFTSINGYKTLPSCSGHFLNSNEIKEKYRSVQNDLNQIKNKEISDFIFMSL